ncbi:hypothetical protein M0R89_18550 (plasmid) [Halorussus limi]|uniref:DUF2238 domain-containing protein n=1 Tax=Halorussus limi TaxID=2938695 RepID=A0A8U0I1A0_9EURY|nr:hypothetical protein [Halorussus limi]UPV76534.1 hypothetical protein M0R89_18550 [Halorussus limi]
MSDDVSTGDFPGRRRNAVLAWAAMLAIAAAAAISAISGDYLWTGLGLAAVVVAAIPAVAYRRWSAALPWEVVAFLAVPYALQSLDLFLPRSIATYLVVPALALAVAVEFDAFTAVEMSPGFAVVFVVTATMAAAGTWAVVRWVADLAFDTQNLRGLYSVMWSLAAATGIGVVAGVAFAVYLRRVDRERLGFRTDDSRQRPSPRSPRSGPSRADDGNRNVGGTDLRGRFGLSERRQRQVVRGLQLALAAVLIVGLVQRSVGVVVNAGVALAVTGLPGLLEHDYGLPIDTGLTLWIVVPVFLHAIGSFGLYDAIGLWDNLTHTLSSSLVAAVGYATVRAFDVHDAEVYFPRKFVAAFILIFTMAFGVLWELLEFGIDGFASQTGMESILAQHGLANTMTDLVFDCLGAFVVAVWGGAYLAGVSRSLADRMTADGESE